MSQAPNSKLQSNGLDFTPTIRSDTYDFIKPEQFDLSGRAVFVTGTSKGIGRAVSASFARAGASFIAIAARSALAEVEQEVLAAASKAGRNAPQVLALTLDVSDEHSVQQAAADVTKAFGRLDILINNAGYLSAPQPIADTRVDEWWRNYEVNVKGTYLVTRAFLPLLLKDGMKTISNISSVGSHLLTPGLSGYQSSKFAILRFTEFIDQEYAKDGILTFATHPGSLKTELALALPEEVHHLLKDTPDLCADAIVFYTAERKDWLAGRYVSVQWDMEQFLQKREQIVKENLLKVRMDVGLE